MRNRLANQKTPQPTSALGGTFYFSLSKIVMMVTAYAIYIVLGNILSVEEFGIFGILGGLNLIFDLVLITGTTQTVARFVSKQPEVADAVRRRSLIAQLMVGSSLCLVFIAGSGFIAESLFNDPGIQNHLRVIGIIIFLYSLYGVFIGFLNGLKYFRIQAAFDMVLSFCKMIFIVLAVLLGYGALGAAFGFVLSALITLLLIVPFVHRRDTGPTAPRFSLKEILAFEYPIMLLALVLNLTLNLDLFMVKALTEGPESNTYAGYYTAVGSLSRVAYQSVIAISLVVFPLISSVTGTPDQIKTKNYINNSMRYALMITLFFGVAISSNAESIIGFMYPEPYIKNASLPLSIVVFGTSSFGIFMILTTILSGTGRPKMALVFALIAIVLHISINSFTIPRYQLIGAAAGTCVALIVSTVIAATYVAIKYKALLSIKSFLRITLTAAVLYFATDFLEPTLVTVMPKIALMFVAFVGILIAGGEFSKQEKQKIFELIKIRKPQKEIV